MRIRVCGALATLISMLLIASLHADTIRFTVSGNTVSVAHIGTERVVSDFFGDLEGSSTYTPCFGALCSIDVFALSQAPDFGPGGATLYVQDPKSGLVVDVVLGVNPSPMFPDAYSLTFTFFSSPSFSCPAYGCNIVANGSVQTLYAVKWGDNSIDTIEFQSPVPEPASILFLASGFPGVLALHRRRRA